MHVRTPDIRPEEGPLVWSKLAEFAFTYNAYSAVIPYVEYHLNSVMNRVRAGHCADHPLLKQRIEDFVKQETAHAQYHVRFNQRMLDENIEGLKALVDRMVADLKRQRAERSLAFNVGYCVGFECIATFAWVYIHEQCDRYFEGADPHGANLLLWHVAEEFEHRAVCHDAYRHVSGNYFIRIAALLYAFWHVGGAFVNAEALVQKHYSSNMTPAQRKASARRSRALFWRQIRYVAPRMPRIFLPRYNPASIRVSPGIEAALAFYKTPGPIGESGLHWRRGA